MEKSLLELQKKKEKEVLKSAKAIINHYKTILQNNAKVKLTSELLFEKNDMKNIIKFFIIIDFCEGQLNITEYKVLYQGLSKFQKISSSKSKEVLLNKVADDKEKLVAEYYHFLKCFQKDFPILLEMKSKLNFPYLFIENNFPMIKNTLDETVLNLESQQNNTSRPFKNMR